MTEIHLTTWSARLAALAIIAALLIGSAGTIGVNAAKGRRNSLKSQEFSNNAPIAISDNATSTPSTIQVSGLNQPIAEVAVSLNVYNHPQPADVDVLLVGPGGQTAMIMSDVALASGPATNVNLLIRDSAERQMPTQDPITSGTFQPTNYEFTNNPDTFAPHPLIPTPLLSGSALSVFNGTNANGAWTLFVDDGDNDTPDTNGSFGGGWSLGITTANGIPETAPDAFKAKAGKTLTVPADGVLANDSDPDGDLLSAALVGEPTKGKVQFQPDGSFTYKAEKKAKGTDSFTYLAKDPKGLSSLETVTIAIKKAKKKRKS